MIFRFSLTKEPKPVTTTDYAELVAIKDRLHRDMVRLETLLGHNRAAMNVQQIVMELGLTFSKSEFR